MDKKRIIRAVFLLLFLIVYPFLISSIASAASASTPQLNSDSAVLIDARTGQVLFEKKMHKKQYPASITKVMTGMIALENGNLTDKITMSNEAVFSIGRNAAHIALDVGEILTLEQVLYALAIASANDAANGIAEHIAGDMKSFARLMNLKARELGALNTNFVNAHGLPDDDHYTTAYDMGLIMIQAIKNPQFCKIFSERRYEIPPTNLQPETKFLYNKNDLLNGQCNYEGIIASKSGWTTEAQHTLVTAAERGDRKLVVVVMNSPSAKSKFEDTIALLDYGFNEFRKVRFDIASVESIVPKLDERNIVNIEVKPDEEITRLLHNSLTVDDVETNYKLLTDADAQKIKVEMSLNLKKDSSLMFKNLGDTILTFEIVERNNTEDKKESTGVGLLYYFIAGSSLFALYFIKQRRKRRRHYWNNKIY
ncbi:MAG: D-alanyl-D-alanine carboxypeptidase family protein [Dethiobacteria bacterium]